MRAGTRSNNGANGTTNISAGPQPAGGIDLGAPVLLIVGTIFVVVGGLIIFGRAVRLRRERIAAFNEAKAQEELGREANRNLIAADDSLRDANQEAGVVEIGIRSGRGAPLREALGQAKAELDAAFAIAQQLDDSVPEPPEQRRKMIQEIVDRTGRAQQVVDAQSARIKELRDLERNAPQALDRLDTEAAALMKRLEGSSATRDRLAKYAAGQHAVGQRQFRCRQAEARRSPGSHRQWSHSRLPPASRPRRRSNRRKANGPSLTQRHSSMGLIEWPTRSI